MIDNVGVLLRHGVDIRTEMRHKLERNNIAQQAQMSMWHAATCMRLSILLTRVAHAPLQSKHKKQETQLLLG